MSHSKRKQNWKKDLFENSLTKPCCYCGRELHFFQATLEHLIPKSKGGKNQGNLAIACRPCNNYRGNYSVEEWKKIVCSPGFRYKDFNQKYSDTYGLMYLTLARTGRLIEKKYLK